jgi:hydroxypyruvate reductase
MPKTASQLRRDAERIWRAGIAAVMPDRLVRAHVRVQGDTLLVGDLAIDLRRVGRIAVVGAGKAAGAMAATLEDVLGPRWLTEKNVAGLVNVPADCLLPTQRIVLQAGRPAGVNEPRPEGVDGTRRILQLVASLGPDDICFCLLTGGGSALLPAPVPGISLDDKIRVTRLLSAAGANIEQLNTVRRSLSLVKGGGLARACRAGRLITLIISDVLGDPLEVIASGPTVPASTTADDAIDVIDELSLREEPGMASIIDYLEQRARKGWLRSNSDEAWLATSRQTSPGARGPLPGGALERAVFSDVTHLVLGNNATAVDAAGAEAERLGYLHAMISAMSAEGSAEGVGAHLAEMALRMVAAVREPGPDCLISGGEPTVTLVDKSRRGKGGRNTQLALAALAQLGDCEGIAILSAGTDGEDGPTDAAGAFVTADVVRATRELKLDPRDFLARNDAYAFFRRAGGLFVTGPTHTNVCDVRVVLVDRDVHGTTT